MPRLFLSGQTTCALLLGAGLLLRAQAALRSETPAQRLAAETMPRTKPAEMFGGHTVRAGPPVAPHRGNTRSHVRKGFAHRQQRPARKGSGVRVASKGFRAG